MRSTRVPVLVLALPNDNETGPPDPRVAPNVFGRFADRDFFYVRLKAYF